LFGAAARAFPLINLASYATLQSDSSPPDLCPTADNYCHSGMPRAAADNKTANRARSFAWQISFAPLNGFRK
jgi:hypothetical protein